MADDENKTPKRNRWTPEGGSGGSGVPRPRFSPWLALPLLLIAVLIFNSLLGNARTETVDYSEFVKHVEAGDITGTLSIGSSDITGTFVNAQGEEVAFSTSLSTNFQSDTEFRNFLDENDVAYKFTSPSVFASLLINILPFALVMILIYYFVFKRMGGGANAALNLGRNKVKIYDRKEMKTSFNDVAGVDEAKEELREVVDFLKNPKKYQRLGGRIPKGVLLLGPPGCGKTLLARAVAGEANVPFFFMSGSEFVEMFVGLGAARVRELFQQAKEKAPALVFLDEIDTIGKGRGGAMGAGFGAHDEREQTLNQLLVEMDGFDSSKGVIIMAATNRPDVLDAALVRPGRFDRQVVVDRPDLRGREEILRVHARGVALDPDVQLRTIASRTPGFTGADLENVVNEAALLAARREKNSVTEEELEEAIDRASMGLERRSRVMSEKEKIRVASHEMGHALVAHYSENLDPVHRITIIPRGTAALGLTMVRPARGSLPRHRAGAEGHARVRDGRTRRRGALLRRSVDRRAERPGTRDAGGARDGRGIRHEREGRSAVARSGGRELHVQRAEDLRAHGRGHRPRGQPPAERGARPRREDPDRTPRPAGQAVRAAPGDGDDRRYGPGGVRDRDETDPGSRDGAAEREGASADARAGHGARARGRNAPHTADARPLVRHGLGTEVMFVVPGGFLVFVG